MPRKDALNWREDQTVGRIDECNNDDDDAEHQRHVEVLTGEVQEIPEPGIASEKLGRQRHLPCNAEADPDCGEYERQQRWQDDKPETAPTEREKLAAISRRSPSRLLRPSRILMMANGISTIEMTKMTVTSEMPNQMIARKVQPMPEKEFRNGLRRP